jgi:hypothetical protein
VPLWHNYRVPRVSYDKLPSVAIIARFWEK